MNVVIIAYGAPDDRHPIPWPNEWRLPVKGERLEIPALSSTTLEVADVTWAVRKNGEDLFWECQLAVWGPRLNTEAT